MNAAAADNTNSDVNTLGTHFTWKWKCKLLSFCVQFFATPMDYSPSLPGSSVHGILQNIGVGCHSLLQGIFLTQGLNPGLLHYRQDSLPSEPPGKPPNLKWPKNSSVTPKKHLWMQLPRSSSTSKLETLGHKFWEQTSHFKSKEAAGWTLVPSSYSPS